MELTTTSPYFYFSPDLFKGILLRRICAALMDLLIVCILIGTVFLFCIVTAILTFGAFLIPALLLSLPVIDIIYTTLTIGGHSQATWGQQLFDIKAVDLEGNPPGHLRAFLFIALYYAFIVPTSHLLQLVALMNDRRRTVPDFLSGIVFIRGSQSS